jgi:catechol 2,3-dioxygenase-like lactoylglutathione lyase family enzyme
MCAVRSSITFSASYNSMSDSPIQVRTFDHVTLVVKDLEASREFYVRTLGMDEVPRPDFSFGGLWFQLGVTQIHLIEQHAQAGPAGYPDQVVRENTRNHHIAFRVDDAHAAADVVKQLGLPIVSDAKQRPDGAVQVFVQDPDGHIVELCSGP